MRLSRTAWAAPIGRDAEAGLARAHAALFREIKLVRHPRRAVVETVLRVANVEVWVFAVVRVLHAM